MPGAILMIGCFDTKGAEYAFLREQILGQGGEVLTLNFGTLGSTNLFPVDIEAEAVAEAGGGDLAEMRSTRDRGEAMKTMAAGAAQLVSQLYEDGKIAGIVGMGGTGGSSVITAAMRALPVGPPKVCLSTVAGGNVAPYVGTKDITMIPSITDVAGLNRVSRVLMTRTAGAVVGMTRAEPVVTGQERPVVAASMFGNTTPCVDACRQLLEAAGYEVLVFHATGTGGRAMESLIDDGLVDACLDITTTEWADEICGGVFSAGPDRLSAPGRAGIPHLIVPGCIDMVNFGPIDTVPAEYRDGGRQLYEWNPNVTLMRTNVEENEKLGKIFATKANAATGPVAVLIPQKGVSQLDADDGPFCDRQADRAMFDSLEAHLRRDIPIESIDANINDPEFAERAVERLLQLIANQQSRTPSA